MPLLRSAYTAELTCADRVRGECIGVVERIGDVIGSTLGSGHKRRDISKVHEIELGIIDFFNLLGIFFEFQRTEENRLFFQAMAGSAFYHIDDTSDFRRLNRLKDSDKITFNQLLVFLKTTALLGNLHFGYQVDRRFDKTLSTITLSEKLIRITYQLGEKYTVFLQLMKEEKFSEAQGFGGAVKCQLEGAISQMTLTPSETVLTKILILSWEKKVDEAKMLVKSRHDSQIQVLAEKERRSLEQASLEEADRGSLLPESLLKVD